MTPFMLRVQATAEGAAPPTGPALVATMPRSVAHKRVLAGESAALAACPTGCSAAGPLGPWL